MPRIELEDLLRNQVSTQETSIFLNWIYLAFDNNQAIHRRIINVEPLYYQGAIAGTEFLTYAITKIYACLNLSLLSYGNGGGNWQYEIYDTNNAAFGVLTNVTYYWHIGDGTAHPVGINASFNNFYFARIVPTNYLYFSFTGYRITLN